MPPVGAGGDNAPVRQSLPQRADCRASKGKLYSPFWAYTIIAFATKQQADDLALIVRRRCEAEERRQAREWPCPVCVRYEAAASAQRAILWVLSTGFILDVVRTYRCERYDCTPPARRTGSRPMSSSPRWIYRLEVGDQQRHRGGQTGRARAHATLAEIARVTQKVTQKTIKAYRIGLSYILPW